MAPLNHAALRELAHNLGSSGQNYQDKLQRMLSDDRQYFLDLVRFYIEAGLLEDALQILEEVSQDWDYPMVGYLAGYLNMKLQREPEALVWFNKGAAAEIDYVFPSRLIEVLALEAALERDPQDDHAKYLLGNYYFAHERYEEGMLKWESALGGMPSYDVLLRNLGLAYWQRAKDPAKAIGFLERALAINPKNYDLYLHLDDLYKAEGLIEKRTELLGKIQTLDEPREDVRKRKVNLLVDLGRYEEALKILTTEVFVPLEMDQSFHDLYVRAWMQRADCHLKTNQIKDAITDYQRALEYPPNLGVGQPTTMAQAEIHYQLGCAFETLGMYQKAIAAWQAAAREHHAFGDALFESVQNALDKLSRYSELGIE
jgi:tetratricopeptide (TPR) repeat protein